MRRADESSEEEDVDLLAPAKGDPWMGLGGIDDLPKDLTQLDLSWRTLARLPKSLGEVSTLTELRLAGTAVTVPSSLSTLSSLALIDLSYTTQALPPLLMALPRLRTLLLAGHVVGSLPTLPHLQTLDLHGCWYQELPEGLVTMRSLTCLHLSRAKLITLPADIASLPLRQADFSFNRLTSIAPLLTCPLRQLKAPSNQLHASRTPILPSTSSTLVMIDLSDNSLLSLPELQAYPSLMMLTVSHNSLRTLPSLANCPRLRLLDVSHNRLRALPDSLSVLTALRTLRAHLNRISRLPPLPSLHLSELQLSANKLSSLADLSSYTALVSLAVSSNRLNATLTLPSSLTSLFVAHNALPRKALVTSGSMPVLQELSVSGNPLLARVPASMPALKHLHASTCGLKASGSTLSALRSSNSSLRSLHLVANTKLLNSSASQALRTASMPELVLDEDLVTPPASPSGLQLMSHSSPEISNVAFASTIGRRAQQEDTHVITRMQDGALVMALFDGHGGAQAAIYAATNIEAHLTAALMRHPPHQAVREALTSLDASFLQQWRASQPDQSVTCPGASAVVVHCSKTQVCVANVGDTRAVLVRGRRTAVRLTEEHKAYEEKEAVRIVSLGGQVVGDGHTGYVNRRLALTRAVGDYRTRHACIIFYVFCDITPFVVCDPATSQECLTAEDTHLIIACDGLWDCCDDLEAARICRRASGSYTAAARLRDLAFALGSDDNVRILSEMIHLHSIDFRARRRVVGICIEIK